MKSESAPGYATRLENVFAHLRQTMPRNLALLAPDRSPLTFAQLGEHLDTVQEALSERGLEHTARIALLAPNGPKHALAFLASAAYATSGITLTRLEFPSKTAKFDVTLAVRPTDDRLPFKLSTTGTCLTRHALNKCWDIPGPCSTAWLPPQPQEFRPSDCSRRWNDRNNLSTGKTRL